MFVSGGHVVRTRAAFRSACDAMVAPRTGAVFVTDTVSAHLLSPDAAFVVREGVYTVNFKDGSSRRTYLIMTSVWARQAGHGSWCTCTNRVAPSRHDARRRQPRSQE